MLQLCGKVAVHTFSHTSSLKLWSFSALTSYPCITATQNSSKQWQTLQQWKRKDGRFSCSHWSQHLSSNTTELSFTPLPRSALRVYSTPKCPATELWTASILDLRIGSIDGSVVTGIPLLQLDLGSIVGALLPILSPDIKSAVSLCPQGYITSSEQT